MYNTLLKTMSIVSVDIDMDRKVMVRMMIIEYLRMNRVTIELIVYNEIEIAKVKKRYLYNKKDMLSGECNINRYKLMLKNLIIQFDEDILSYKNRISDLYGKYSKN